MSPRGIEGSFLFTTGVVLTPFWLRPGVKLKAAFRGCNRVLPPG